MNPSVPPSKPLIEKFRRAWAMLTPRSAWAEVLVWVLIVAAAVGTRMYLSQTLPVYIWSKDSTSYLAPAFAWMEQGSWHSDVRRGPVYSLFLGLILRATGDMSSVVWVQHALGAVSVLGAALLLRKWTRRAGLLPLLFCAACYGLYQLPVYIEHLIRNETLLLFFATLAFVSWGMALASGGVGWLALSGLAAGLLNLTKSVFLPFPVLVAAFLIWQHWRKWRALAVALPVFLAAYMAPSMAAKIQSSLQADEEEGMSGYGGVQLYGRVAQWTVLEGNTRAELRQAIAPLVKEYRARPKLDNNWVIYRGIIPVIHEQLGKPPFSEVNRVCKELAIEAIRANPGAFMKQVAGDIWKLNAKCAWNNRDPNAGTLTDMAGQLRKTTMEQPEMRKEHVIATYEAKSGKNTFKAFHRLTDCAVLFETLPPVLLASLLLPLLIVFSKGSLRLFWLTAAGVWFFNILLLATVGKPMNRYIVPIAPIMFWTLSAPLVALWRWIDRSLAAAPAAGAASAPESVR